MLDNFTFSMPIPLRWNDLDPLGHVNNIYYFEYFQIARAEYMPTACPQWDWSKNMFVIAHIQCDYLKEITLQTINPTIYVRTAELSNKSFEMEYLITSRSKDNSIIVHAKGKSINVMVDALKKKTIEIPEWLRASIQEYDKN